MFPFSCDIFGQIKDLLEEAIKKILQMIFLNYLPFTGWKIFLKPKL